MQALQRMLVRSSCQHQYTTNRFFHQLSGRDKRITCILTLFPYSSRMDALSTPVTTSFKSGGCGGGGSSLFLPSSPRSSISHLKSSSFPLPSPASLTFHTKPQSLRPTSRPKFPLQKSPLPKAHASLHTRFNSATFHHRAATGYAAALADATCCAGTLAAADVDARRLVQLLRGVISDPSLKETEKAEMVMKATQSGGYEKHVVALIKLLAKKGKLGLVEEVISEFSVICDELSSTKVVLMGPSESRGEAVEFERIAREVQRTSGASRVKVRHVVSV